MSDLERKLATARRDDWSTMSPYIQQLLNDGAAATSSTALVDAAQKQIQRTALGVDEGMNNRQLSRAGTNLTSSQRLAMTGLNSVDAAANNTATSNAKNCVAFAARTRSSLSVFICNQAAPCIINMLTLTRPASKPNGFNSPNKPPW